MVWVSLLSGFLFAVVMGLHSLLRFLRESFDPQVPFMSTVTVLFTAGVVAIVAFFAFNLGFLVGLIVAATILSAEAETLPSVVGIITGFLLGLFAAWFTRGLLRDLLLD